MTLRFGIAFAVGACTPTHELDIQGALPGQLGVIHETLRAMGEEVQPGKFPDIRHIVFTDRIEDNEWSGKWHDEQRTVELDHSLEGDDLEAALRHEVCHAIDSQSGFHVSERDWPVVEGIPTGAPGDGALRSELFAYLCMLGQSGLDLLLTAGRACTPEEVIGAADRTQAWVFRPLEDVPLIPPDLIGTLSWPDPNYHVIGSSTKWAGPELLAVVIEDDRGLGRYEILDVDTASWRDSAGLEAATTSVQLTGRGAAIQRWVTATYELPDKSTFVLRALDPVWGASVNVPGIASVALTLADGCAPEMTPAVMTMERAILVGVREGAVQWVEFTGLLDEALGHGWGVNFEDAASESGLP